VEFRFPKRSGPLNSTGAGLLNHQTSKFSLFCLMNQNLLMRVLNLRFRRGNWAPNVRGTLEMHWGLDFKSSNIYFLPFLLIESKSVGRCLQFENLKGELAPQHFGDPKISLGP
jgi:hypothetical protein